MFLLQEELKTHEVEMEKLQKKVDELDKEELFELTDILINSKDIRFCVWDFKSLLRCF